MANTAYSAKATVVALLSASEANTEHSIPWLCIIILSVTLQSLCDFIDRFIFPLVHVHAGGMVAANLDVPFL